MINYGVVYPQAILIFTITLLYSVIQPLIVVFGAVYFGMAYVVYKYKLLFGMFTLSTQSPGFLNLSQFSTSPTSLRVKHGQLHSYDCSGVSSST